MPYTPLPPTPQRSDPASFADRGDAFLAALPGFGSEMNANQQAASNSASAAGLGASAASGSAQTASTAAASAVDSALAAGAVAWVSGTAYPVGAARFSLANLRTYRRLVAGAGTTDPASDAANWLPVSVGATVYPYDSRASLRTGAPAAASQALVLGVGLFVFVAGSVEPDDDETAFAAAGGVWELTAADPDYVFASRLADFDRLQSQVEDNAAKFLRGSFVMSLTSLAATSSSGFTTTVAGAAVGDSVLVNPGNDFGNSAADQARLSYAAYVSADSTVTVSIRNASALSAAMNASTWAVLVIKP